MLLVTDADDLLLGYGDDPFLRHVLSHWCAHLPTAATDGAVGMWCDFWGEPDAFVLGDPGVVPDVAAALLGDDAAGGFASVPVAALPACASATGWTPGETWSFRWTAAIEPLGESAAWLPPEAEGEVRDLLAVAFPDASMPVGHAEVRRWAGLRRDGRLVACAADATMAPGVGFLASIATHPDDRGTGAGAAVTAWAAADLCREHGVAALWHHGTNAVAAALYTRLGFTNVPMAGLIRPD